MDNSNKYEAFSKMIRKGFEDYLQSRKTAISSSIRILKDDNEDARWMAAEVLGEIGDKVAIDPLISAFYMEQSPDVRCAILRALYAHTDEERVLDVFKYTMECDTDPLVKEEARELIEIEKIPPTSPIYESITEKITQLGKVKKHLLNLGGYINTLLQTQNLALVGNTLSEESSKRRHVHSEKIECVDLDDYGYTPQLRLRSELKDNTLTLIFDLKPKANPSPIFLIVRVGNVEKKQPLKDGKKHAEFVFDDYNTDQQYDVYVSPLEK